MSEVPRKLQHLARMYGVQPSFRDMRQQKREASSESLLAVIRMMGAELETLDDVNRAIERRQRELWERIVEPVVIAWNGEIPPISIRTRGDLSTAPHVILMMEDGGTEELDTRLARLPVRGRQQIGNAGYIQRELTIVRRLPPGYHHLTLEIGKQCFETLIISAPTQAY